MPGVVRKLLILAASDGLVLQPLAQRSQRVAAPLKVDYQSHDVVPLLSNVQQDAQKAEGLEVSGVIGILKVAGFAFLISISKKQQVAQILGKPIYVITGVSILPIESQTKAQAAIDATGIDAVELHDGDYGEALDGDSLGEPDDDTLTTGDNDSLDANASSEAARPNLSDAEKKNSADKTKNNIAEDVISKKGIYGRFANRWFSRTGWTTGQRRTQGMSSEYGVDHDLAYSERPPLNDMNQDASNTGSTAESSPHIDRDSYKRWPQTPLVSSGLQGGTLAGSLVPKLIKTATLLFASRTFYFSYDYDITHSLATQRQTSSDNPFFSDVDPEYFWNNNLAIPLIEKGFNEYVLPIMQGFVGQRQFALESGRTQSSAMPESIETPGVTVKASVHNEKPPGIETEDDSKDKEQIQQFLLTLISRRSVYRSGLRYLRRGFDEEGHTANAVETEQLLSFSSWDSESKVQSFLQTRGSIPVFFSQIPYTFKPPPTLHGSPEANLTALRKHFSDLTNRYGAVEAVSLVDKHGSEVEIGEAYEDNVKTLNATGGANGKTIGFEWFEFHNVCRGMKFENVSKLIETMSPFLTSNGWTTSQASKINNSQSGIIRTNCMDCLDRTNVVQSALGQRTLEHQLASLGFSVDLTSDLSTTWFNTLWADNGDAVSRAYTGTSALKGDYTRTRKRNMVGALTDLSLTLSRYYHNLFDDFFAQAAIDYLLGVVTADVFAEFEARMTTADPAIDLRKARQAAIATASNVVVEESEDVLHGWTLKTPALPNTLRTFPFKEVLILLTNKALYHVQFDWNASKVRSFERIDLTSIQSLQRGTYVTETHASFQTDPKHNVGFIMRYQAFSTESDGEEDDSGTGTDELRPNPKQRPPTIRVNTRTLENVRDAWSITGADGRHDEPSDADSTTAPSDSLFIAFKALPPSSAIVKQVENATPLLTEQESVRMICAEIASAANAARGTSSEVGADGEQLSRPYDAASHDATAELALDEASKRSPSDVAMKPFKSPIVVEEKDILSINEAKASTGYLERVEWGIKKVLWG